MRAKGASWAGQILGDPSVAFEWGFLMDPLPVHHEEVIPMDPDNPLLPHPDPVLYQIIQT